MLGAACPTRPLGTFSKPLLFKAVQGQLSNWHSQEGCGFYLTNPNLENILNDFNIIYVTTFLNEDILLDPELAGSL